MWSLESVSLRPHSIPYDFGFVTTRRRFSQITRIILILETLAAAIDREVTWIKLRQSFTDFKCFESVIKESVALSFGGDMLALLMNKSKEPVEILYD
ncbi:MAG: hypothetical protein WAU54_18910 [Chania sp.]